MILYLGLGANLGERKKTLRRAIERIKNSRHEIVASAAVQLVRSRQ